MQSLWVIFVAILIFEIATGNVTLSTFINDEEYNTSYTQYNNSTGKTVLDKDRRDLVTKYITISFIFIITCGSIFVFIYYNTGGRMISRRLFSLYLFSIIPP